MENNATVEIQTMEPGNADGAKGSRIKDTQTGAPETGANQSEGARRLAEALISLAGMIVLSPVYLFIYILLKLEEPGDVIFRQKRIGHKGRIIDILKFRKIPRGVIGGLGVTIGGDSRMSRLGAILEKSKLDEIPQLWNVFRGDMSFVGWRPESLNFAHLYAGEFAEVLKYSPGILGPYQVKHRNESELYPTDREPEEYYVNVLFPYKAQMDLEYLRRRTLLSDLLLLICGVWATLAYMGDWKWFLREKAPHIVRDCVLLELAWILAYAIRFAGIPKPALIEIFFLGLFVIPAVSAVFLYFGGCYRSILRHYTLSDFIKLAKLSLVALAFSYLILIAINRWASLGVMAITGVLGINLLAAPRLYLRHKLTSSALSSRSNSKNVLIYGDNSLAALLVGWARQEAGSVYKIAGIISHNKTSHGKAIDGVQIIGGLGQVENLAAALGKLDELWLAEIPSSQEAEMIYKISARHDMEIAPVAEMRPYSSISEVRHKIDA